MNISLSFDELRDLSRDNGCGVTDAPCPLCGPGRRSPVNQRRKTLRLWCEDPNFISYHCARCGERGWASSSNAVRSSIPASNIPAIKAEIDRRNFDEARERLKVAMSLWRRRLAIEGTAAEIYLREARCYGGRLPATLGFLPASGDYAPAMIAAFGIARETLPGEIVIDDGAVRGVHLTKLKPDGSGKAGTDRDKIMIGKSVGFPIVLAPPNDGLGLAITEGIEDALSIHEATGLGVWAAGSASRMLALAAGVPAYIDSITIVADADKAGRTNSQAFVEALQQGGHEVRLIFPSDRKVA
jgi:Toprim domain-containing protein